MVALQTKKGDVARGPTAEEFESKVMKPLKKLADDIMFKHRWALNNPNQWEPIFSFDKPTIHQGDMSYIGIVDGQNTFPLPHYCADMHKVIEHVHGTLVKLIRKWQWRDRRRYGVEVCKAQLHHAFFKQLTKRSVQKDIKSLGATFKIISQSACRGGTAGDWAPRPYN